MRFSLNRETGLKWARIAVDGDLSKLDNEIKRAIDKNGPHFPRGGAVYFAIKFRQFLKTLRPEFTLFTEGNSKLPFLSWSTLPAVNCPGAGDCLIWCYSFKAWRYPSAYFRQLQNTILERNAPAVIESELEKIITSKNYEGRRVDLRLYVDGDFPNLQIMRQWFKVFDRIPRISAYGYSKSLPLFIEYADKYGNFPANYALNGSSGGKYPELMEVMKTLPIFRGEFVALDIGKKIAPFNMDNEDRRTLRKIAGPGKVFLCPGPCGSCTATGHACGNNDTFSGYTIVTPYH